MMSANDRLADIAFYDSRVATFSDDSFLIPGSNFGRRLRASRPGLDQILEIVRLLREDSSTRRAAAAVYFPEDAGRRSRDIPCMLGLTYNVRDNGLIATTIMRSNNVLRLAPYNLFETSLLSEVIAVEVGVPVGQLSHFAVSMHLYDDENAAAEELLRGNLHSVDQPTPPRMPGSSNPLEQIDCLARLECEMRYMAVALDEVKVKRLISAAGDQLSEYWLSYFAILLSGTIARKSTMPVPAELNALIDPYFRPFVVADSEAGS